MVIKAKEKEKKIKPIKQPTKLVRPPILLDKLPKQDDSHLRNTDKDGKSRHLLPTNNQHQDEHKNNNRESICTNLL